jgi:large subunit ribosomal protein L5
MSNPMAPRLQLKYQQEIAPELAKRLEISNVMAVPRLENLDIAADALTEIAGQRPVLTKSRASIAGFRLREGVPIGAKVTLRRARMYEFLDRLISIVLPRVRDFRGVSRTAFDGNGNYSLGLSEQLVFPELNPDKFTKPQGMNITVVTSAATNEEAFQLLELLGMPFRAPRKPKGT